MDVTPHSAVLTKLNFISDVYLKMVAFITSSYLHIDSSDLFKDEGYSSNSQEMPNSCCYSAETATCSPLMNLNNSYTLHNLMKKYCICIDDVKR